MTPETISPRTYVEKELVCIWEQALQRAPIGIQEDFFDLGGTSVHAALIFAKIEEVFHKRLPLSVIISSSTIERLAAALLPGKCREWNAYVVPIQSQGEKPILFCVGDGVIWRPAAERLGTDQPFFNIGLKPGAVEQMNGPIPLEKLARHIVSALCEKQPQGPYYLGGYCRDAIYAYEVARQLQMYGHEVGLLVLVEPSYPCQNARVRIATVLRRTIFRIGFRFGELRRLEIGQFPRYARSRWNGLKWMLTEVLWRNSARFQVLTRYSGSPDFEKILFVAASSYKPKPLGCPTVIFHCKDWPVLSAGDPYFGWRELLTGRSETHEIPGDHDGIFREPSVLVLAEKLRACLQNKKLLETSSKDLTMDVDQGLDLGLLPH
jgi:thioesterase domain-containing protein